MNLSLCMICYCCLWSLPVVYFEKGGKGNSGCYNDINGFYVGIGHDCILLFSIWFVSHIIGGLGFKCLNVVVRG